MFEFLKKNKALEIENLYRVTFHLSRGTNTEMPPGWLGAFVTFFASGADPELALKKSSITLRPTAMKS